MRIFLSIFLMTTFTGVLQAQLNDYKYIIVPKRFDAFKLENQHLTSTLVKHLFTKRGYLTVYEDQFPDDLNMNRCLGLSVRLDDNSSMFTTKSTLVLVDCKGTELFITEEGKSKKKDYKDAYNESISKAFESFATLDYNYNGKGDKKEQTQEPITVSFKNDVKEIKEEPSAEKPTLNRYQDPMEQQVATQEKQSYQNLEPVDSNYTKAAPQKEEVTKQVATLDEQSYETKAPVASDVVKSDGADGKDIKTLYAQEIQNGFQLVDSTPKIVLKIFRTSVPNVFTAKSEKGTGVVYQKNEKWYYEFYKGEELTTQELNIKF